MQKLATIISYVFHPLLMAFYSIAALFGLGTYITGALPVQSQAIILAFVFFITCAVPGAIIGFMIQFNVISNMDITNYNERRIPYLVTATAYSFNYYLLHKFHLPSLLYYVLLGATVTLLCAMVINLFWKISAHSIGIGGFTGLLVGLSLRMGLYIPLYLSIAFLLCGTIASARLVLRVHTPAQVYAGLALGFVVQFIITQL